LVPGHSLPSQNLVVAILAASHTLWQKSYVYSWPKFGKKQWQLGATNVWAKLMTTVSILVKSSTKK
jgi:hypothetical protein